MSWISDVMTEVRGLKRTKRELKRFGLLVGGVFVLLGIGGMLGSWRISTIVASETIGTLLVLGGLLFPVALRGIYTVWMGTAFAIGWIISRVILVLLYYLVITPVGLAARLMGKEFLDIDFRKKNQSYWMQKGKTKKTNYEKLF